MIGALALLNVVWGLWELAAAQGTSSMATGLPACSGLWLREGFTYEFRDPHRGEIVTFHARGSIGSTVRPDPDSRQLGINKRVIALPGETVVGRDNRVYVDGQKVDDIPTDPFPSVHLGPHDYFVPVTTAAAHRTAETSAPSHARRSTRVPCSSSGRSDASAPPATASRKRRRATSAVSSPGAPACIAFLEERTQAVLALVARPPLGDPAGRLGPVGLLADESLRPPRGLRPC